MTEIRIYPAQGVWVVRADGAVIAESSNALELNEPGHPWIIYFPRTDVAMAFLEASDTRTTCPHKGAATYFHIAGPGNLIHNGAWTYEAPNEGVEQIAGYLAFDGLKVTVERI